MRSSKSYFPTGKQRVPNLQPTTLADYRIALIGEAPGEAEELRYTPFVGASGWHLQRCLAHADIDREACFLGNVIQYRPEGNEISTVDPQSTVWREGQKYLIEGLEKFKPNLVVLMGNTPLKLFTGHDKIGNWRGSIIEGRLGEKTYKCLPTYHPAACLRDFQKLTPLLRFDLERAIAQGTFPEIRRQPRTLLTDLNLDSLLTELSAIKSGDTVAFDIEGGCDTMSCISFATDTHYAFNIPFQTLQGNHKSGRGNSVWSVGDETLLLRALARVLEDGTIRKITQNGIAYDNFCLAFSQAYRIPVANVEDIMMLNWELLPEQDKNLGTQISIWIDEPYHKDGREATTDHAFWEYCAKDSCTTLEIWYEQNKYLDACDPSYRARAREHYEFNRDVGMAMLYTSLRGMRYDTEAAQRAATKIAGDLVVHQKYLDDKFGACSFTIPKKKKTKKELAAEALLSMGNTAIQGSLFGDMEDLAPKLPTPRGRFNVKSPQQKAALIYGLKGYSHFNRKTKSSTSTDEMTIITLANKHDDADLWELLRAIRCRTALSNLAFDELGKPARSVVDPDGRIRFSYNVVGTKTGRTSCYGSNSGSGFNGQTITKTKGCNMREFYLADEGYLYLQADLEGADSWTVAAYCKMLGDSSMYDHLSLGIKPAKVLRLVLSVADSFKNGNEQEWLDIYDDDVFNNRDSFSFAVSYVKSLPHELLKTLTKAAPDDELYRVCKAVGHGTCYKMGPGLVGDIVFKQTEGQIDFSQSQCEQYQGIYLTLYPGVRKYHDYIFDTVSEDSYIDCASGHRRNFLGIRWAKNKFGRPVIDPETHREALAEEPQANTTYVTNEILRRLYYEDYNRVEVKRSLRYGATNPFYIEPLHQVHDAINGQVKVQHVMNGTAQRIFSRASDITLRIADMDIKIPIDVKLGPSWGKAMYNLDGSLIKK